MNKRFPSPVALKPGTARSAGQCLTYWATGAPWPEYAEQDLFNLCKYAVTGYNIMSELLETDF